MEKATETFVAVYLAVIGLSHVAQPRAWVDFFTPLRGKAHAGVFVNGSRPSKSPIVRRWAGTSIPSG